MKFLMLVFLVDLVVVLVDILQMIVVEHPPAIHSQEIPQIPHLQMVGDMMVVMLPLQVISKVPVVVALAVLVSLSPNQQAQLHMDLVVQVFNFQQHSVILDLHLVELVELDHITQMLVVV
jgi:hypothetical protein